MDDGDPELEDLEPDDDEAGDVRGGRKIFPDVVKTPPSSPGGVPIPYPN